MNTKTEIATEYAPFGLTEKGRWHKLIPFFCKSQESAEKDLRLYKEQPLTHKCKEYKVMKRTTITTISEWEDLKSTEKD